jgi:hypothetical protein
MTTLSPERTIFTVPDPRRLGTTIDTIAANNFRFSGAILVETTFAFVDSTAGVTTPLITDQTWGDEFTTTGCSITSAAYPAAYWLSAALTRRWAIWDNFGGLIYEVVIDKSALAGSNYTKSISPPLVLAAGTYRIGTELFVGDLVATSPLQIGTGFSIVTPRRVAGYGFPTAIPPGPTSVAGSFTYTYSANVISTTSTGIDLAGLSIDSATSTIKVDGVDIDSLIDQDVRTVASPTFAGVTFSGSVGTPTALTDCTSGLGILQFGGAITANANYSYSRVGKNICLNISGATGVFAGISAINNVLDPLPPYLRPAGGVYAQPIVVSDAGINLLGTIEFTSAGLVTISREIGNPFIGPATSGFAAFTLGYVGA